MAEATEDDVADAGLHLGHHRAAQGRDALGVQRGVRDQGARRGRRVRLSAAIGLGRHAVLPAAVPRRGADLHHLVQRRRRHPGALRRVDRDRAGRTCARCSRRFSSACRASGRRCSPAVQIRIDSATWLKRMLSRFWLRVADGIGRDAGAHRWPAHRRVRGCATPSVGSSSTARCRTGSACARSGYAASGAAPIAPEVLRFFMGIGVPMHEVYGMTENTAVATANRPGRVKLGTVGEPHARHRAAHRRGHRRDPHPPPRHVRRLLEEPGGHRATIDRRRLAAHR